MRILLIAAVLSGHAVWAKTARSSEERPPTHVNAEYHYRLTLPKGWVRIPEEWIARGNAELKQSMGTKAKVIIAAFQPANIDWYSGPTVQLYHMPQYGGMSLGDLLKGMSSLPSAFPKLVDVYTAVSDGHAAKPYIDSQKKMVIFVTGALIEDVGQVMSVGALCPGKRGVVQLQLGSPAATYSTLRPVIRSILNSFEFEPGYGSEGK